MAMGLHDQQTPRLVTRRAFATLCGSVAGVAIVVPAATAQQGEDAFRALSARLTGFGPSALDAGFAGELRRELLALGHARTLDALARTNDETTPETAELEAEIISAWYSGVFPTPAGPVVGALYGALVWTAANFATAPGMCHAGDWATAPEGATPVPEGATPAPEGATR